MSWLLARSRPRAWLGSLDDFNRNAENPVRQPWKKFGNAGGGEINGLQELHIFNAPEIDVAGGVSYEFEPFTPNYGFEAEIWAPYTGILGQALYIYFMQNWAKAGDSPTYDQVTSVGVTHTIADGDRVNISEVPSLGLGANELSGGATPVAINGNYFILKILVEDDRWFRAYFNNTLICSATFSPSYATAITRRGLNIWALRTDAWMRWIRLFDRDPSAPKSTVYSFLILTDTFDRANGAAGNGWTTDGTSVGITANSWGMNTGSPSDGSRGLTRDTGITNGRMRVEATVGGQHGISNSQDSSILLCCNAARTQGLAANVFGNKVYLARWSGSLTSPTFTDLAARTNSVSIVNGDVLAANVYDGVMWLEKVNTGERLIFAENVHSVVPASNSWGGVRVERAAFVNSNSWNSVTIKAA